MNEIIKNNNHKIILNYIAIIAITGVMPYFLNTSWSLILIFRVFLGIGVGMISIRNSLLLLSIPKEKQAVYIGYGSAIMKVAPEKCEKNIKIGKEIFLWIRKHLL